MNAERDKFLTEAMGECWHECSHLDLSTGVYCCDHCGQYFYKKVLFSSWLGFGKLWEWAQQQEWWFSFWKNDFGVPIVKANLIHPDRFANAVYEFLKEQVNDRAN